MGTMTTNSAVALCMLMAYCYFNLFVIVVVVDKCKNIRTVQLMAHGKQASMQIGLVNTDGHRLTIVHIKNASDNTQIMCTGHTGVL